MKTRISLVQAVFLYLLGYVVFIGGASVRVHGDFAAGVWVMILGLLIWGYAILSRSYHGEFD